MFGLILELTTFTIFCLLSAPVVWIRTHDKDLMKFMLKMWAWASMIPISALLIDIMLMLGK